MPEQNAPNPSPAITSKNLPGAPVTDAVLSDDEIEARPLVLPDFVNVKHKNPNIELRWIKYGESEPSKNRFQTAMFQGFVPVTPDELATPMKHLEKDNRIFYGDLILCKMDKRMYRGALKAKDEQAARLASRGELFTRGQQNVRDEAKKVNAPEGLLRKVSVFTPTDKELSSLVGADKEQKK